MRKILQGFLLFILAVVIVIYVFAMNSDIEMSLGEHVIVPLISIIIIVIIVVLRKIKI